MSGPQIHVSGVSQEALLLDLNIGGLSNVVFDIVCDVKKEIVEYSFVPKKQSTKVWDRKRKWQV